MMIVGIDAIIRGVGWALRIERLLPV